MSNMKRTIIWIDDIRNPKTYGIDATFWARTYDEFVGYVKTFGKPDEVWFDHDLGEFSKSGYDCAKWLTEYCYDNGLMELPEYHVQSANPVGRENILSILRTYEKLLEKNF